MTEETTRPAVNDGGTDPMPVDLDALNATWNAGVEDAGFTALTDAELAEDDGCPPWGHIAQMAIGDPDPAEGSQSISWQQYRLACRALMDTRQRHIDGAQLRDSVDALGAEMRESAGRFHELEALIHEAAASIAELVAQLDAGR